MYPVDPFLLAQSHMIVEVHKIDNSSYSFWGMCPQNTLLKGYATEYSPPLRKF